VLRWCAALLGNVTDDGAAFASRAPLNVPSKLTLEPGACGRCAGDEKVFCSGVA
jgi:hypothetical protein